MCWLCWIQFSVMGKIAEAVEELRGMNTSWSHHRLCDLQRQAARMRHSRPSIPDTSKHHRVLSMPISRVSIDLWLDMRVKCNEKNLYFFTGQIDVGAQRAAFYDYW